MSPMQLFVPLFFLGMFIRGKSKKAGAIYDIVWSVGILIWALQVMSEGDQIALFGRIELPPYVVIGILAAMIASDIFTLVKVSKEAPQQAQAAQELAAAKQAELARLEESSEKLAAPCVLYIAHRQGVIGAVNKMQLSLNGRELMALGNSEVVRTQLNLRQNKLTAVCNGMAESALSFDVGSSCPMRIDVRIKAGQGIVLEQNPNTTYREPLPGQNRVRPLNVGMVLWSVFNFWCYLMGIFTLKMTLRAAEHPFDDVAEAKLKQARTWNLVMTVLLVLVVAAIAVLPHVL